MGRIGGLFIFPLSWGIDGGGSKWWLGMGRVGGWVGWLDDGLLGLIASAFSSDIHSVCMEVLYVCRYARCGYG